MTVPVFYFSFFFLLYVCLFSGPGAGYVLRTFCSVFSLPYSFIFIVFLPSDLCVHEVPFSVELVSVKCVLMWRSHTQSVCVFDLLVSTDSECLEQLCMYLLTHSHVIPNPYNFLSFVED